MSYIQAQLPVNGFEFATLNNVIKITSYDIAEKSTIFPLENHNLAPQISLTLITNYEVPYGNLPRCTPL